VVRVDPAEVMTRTADPPDAVLRYAAHDDGLVDVHLPADARAEALTGVPVVVLLHGGFWRVAYDRRHTRPMANALAAAGFVVASPEYRRVGGKDELAGGWPTTFEDVSSALAALPGLLGELGVTAESTTVVGHSAGGHLALWLANEETVVDRVVGLAPVGNLRAAAAHATGGEATLDLLGGSPAQVPDRYESADPASRLDTPPGCQVVVVHGTHDEQVPVQSSRGLASRHRFITYHELPGIEHFALIDPLSPAWPTVLAAIRGQ
jgi:acetyl esterase/lipase